MDKHPTSIRLSSKAKELIQLLAAHLGISRTAVIEVAIRALAKAERTHKDQH